MTAYASTLFRFLTSPALPGQILWLGGEIATVIITIGVGIWSVRGAWHVLLRLVRVENKI